MCVNYVAYIDGPRAESDTSLTGESMILTIAFMASNGSHIDEYIREIQAAYLCSLRDYESH